jgi:isochorismate synthase
MHEVLKHKVTIAGAVRICLTKKVHFAAYKLPGKTEITLVVQKDPASQALGELSDNLPEKGFLVVPFTREENKAYLIRPDMVLRDEMNSWQFDELSALPDRPVNDSINGCPKDTRKADYIRLIQDSIGKINAGEFEKVVLSRVKSVPGNYTSHLSEIFQILCDSYPHAFVYLFSVNGQCWTGATPEPFICSHNDMLNTVSLAGTRPYHEADLDICNWNRKELLEQDYVTLHIEKILKNYDVSAFKKKGPYVTRAGNLLHLRTDFTFSVRSVGSRLPSLIHALHPTPAVCGMSTGKAMDYIRASEKHNREYYTGFLGPVGIDDLMQLYVNLRCLKVYNNRLILYIGGGITHDSNPEEEWEETEIKADTLLSVLKQIR